MVGHNSYSIDLRGLREVKNVKNEAMELEINCANVPKFRDINYIAK